MEVPELNTILLTSDLMDIVFLLLYSSVRDPNLVKRIGEATALEVRATGIQYVFAPCIAVSTKILTEPKQKHSLFVVVNNFEQVCRDPRWGRCYESYSEDHKIVQQMTEIIPGLQGDLPRGQKGVPFVAGK